MLSPDQSYDNKTIASTLKMQIRTVQRAQGDDNKVSVYGYGLWCGFNWVFAELPPTLVEKVYSQFRIRIEALIEAEGGYLE